MSTIPTASRPSSRARSVDLRSDTVTKPTGAMRAAMAAAEVGDDFLGEDPTSNMLAVKVQSLFGAAGAIFVPSGRMANLVSLKSLTQPGDEVICHESCHLLNYEGAALAGLCGAQPRALPGQRGVLDPGDIAAAVRPKADWAPRTSLIALENTHNHEGGAVYPIDALRAARKVADEHGLSLYLDGARIFNASVASGVPVSEYCAQVDGMMFSFSKGLGCPVGSMVLGTEAFITRAQRYRKMVGGGMRQVGILAAACLVALETMVGRLAEDHANARTLAQGLDAIAPGSVDLEGVQTNIVMVNTSALGYEAQELVAEMAGRGVKFFAFGPSKVRLVTHKDVSSEDVAFAVEQMGAAGGLRR